MTGEWGTTALWMRRYYYFKNMPVTKSHTPVAEIRARQFGALRSFVFEPVVPVSVSAPLYRPLHMKVSS
jgi:hypothetical protein